MYIIIITVVVVVVVVVNHHHHQHLLLHHHHQQSKSINYCNCAVLINVTESKSSYVNCFPQKKSNYVASDK